MCSMVPTTILTIQSQSISRHLQTLKPLPKKTQKKRALKTLQQNIIRCKTWTMGSNMSHTPENSQRRYQRPSNTCLNYNTYSTLVSDMILRALWGLAYRIAYIGFWNRSSTSLYSSYMKIGTKHPLPPMATRTWTRGGEHKTHVRVKRTPMFLLHLHLIVCLLFHWDFLHI